MIEFKEFLYNDFPVVFLGIQAPLFAEAAGFLRIAEEFPDCPGDPGDVVIGDDDAGLPINNCITYAPRVGRNDRLSAGSCLEVHDAESFEFSMGIFWRVHIDIGDLEEGDEVVPRSLPAEFDVVLEVQFIDERFERFPCIALSDDEVQDARFLWNDACERAEDEVVALPADEGADSDEDLPSRVLFLECCEIKLLLESRDVYAIVDNFDGILFLRIFLNLVAGEVTGNRHALRRTVAPLEEPSFWEKHQWPDSVGPLRAHHEGFSPPFGTDTCVEAVWKIEQRVDQVIGSDVDGEEISQSCGLVDAVDVFG